MEKRKKNGFTLVELLVVIAILAVLASVTVVGYLGFVKKANESKINSELTELKTALISEAALEEDFSYELKTGLKFKNSVFENKDAIETKLKSYFGDNLEATIFINNDLNLTDDVYLVTEIFYRLDNDVAVWNIHNDEITMNEKISLNVHTLNNEGEVLETTLEGIYGSTLVPPKKPTITNPNIQVHDFMMADALGHPQRAILPDEIFLKNLSITLVYDKVTTSPQGLSYSGNNQEVEILPVAGVTKLSDDAFKNNKDVQKIKLGKGITSVGNDAFSGCDNLTEVIFEDPSVALPTLVAMPLGVSSFTIGSGVFSGCTKLERVIIRSDYESNDFNNDLGLDKTKTRVYSYQTSGDDSSENVYYYSSSEDQGKWGFSDSSLVHWGYEVKLNDTTIRLNTNPNTPSGAKAEYYNTKLKVSKDSTLSVYYNGEVVEYQVGLGDNLITSDKKIRRTTNTAELYLKVLNNDSLEVHACDVLTVYYLDLTKSESKLAFKVFYPLYTQGDRLDSGEYVTVDDVNKGDARFNKYTLTVRSSNPYLTALGFKLGTGEEFTTNNIEEGKCYFGGTSKNAYADLETCYNACNYKVLINGSSHNLIYNPESSFSEGKEYSFTYNEALAKEASISFTLGGETLEVTPSAGLNAIYNNAGLKVSHQVNNLKIYLKQYSNDKHYEVYAEEKVTVYYENNLGWANVYGYAHITDENDLGMLWTGNKLTKVEENPYTFVFYTPVTSDLKVTFHDGLDKTPNKLDTAFVNGKYYVDTVNHAFSQEEYEAAKVKGYQIKIGSEVTKLAVNESYQGNDGVEYFVKGISRTNENLVEAYFGDVRLPNLAATTENNLINHTNLQIAGTGNNTNIYLQVKKDGKVIVISNETANLVYYNTANYQNLSFEGVNAHVETEKLQDATNHNIDSYNVSFDTASLNTVNIKVKDNNEDRLTISGLQMSGYYYGNSSTRYETSNALEKAVILPYQIKIGNTTYQLMLNKVNNSEYILASNNDSSISLEKDQIVTFLKNDLAYNDVSNLEGNIYLDEVDNKLKIHNSANISSITLKNNNTIHIAGSDNEKYYKARVEGSDILAELVLNSDNNSEYMAELTLVKGKKIFVYVDGKLVSLTKKADNGGSINNLNADLTIHNSATANIYVTKDSYNIWVNGWAYDPDYEEGYYVQIGDASFKLSNEVGNEVQLLNATLTEGQTLAFRLDGKALAVSAKDNMNNNLDLGLVVRKSSLNSTISLDKGTKEIWVTGNEGAEVGIYAHIGNASYKFEQNPNNRNEQYVIIPQLNKGDVIEFRDNGIIIPVTLKGGCNATVVENKITVNNNVANGGLYLEFVNQEKKLWVTADSIVKVTLNPNANWKIDSARFAVHLVDGSLEGKWENMVEVDGQYVVILSRSSFNEIIFCRMKGSTTNTWGNKMNQTTNLNVPAGSKATFTIPEGAWDGSTDTGNWS